MFSSKVGVSTLAGVTKGRRQNLKQCSILQYSAVPVPLTQDPAAWESSWGSVSETEGMSGGEENRRKPGTAGSSTSSLASFTSCCSSTFSLFSLRESQRAFLHFLLSLLFLLSTSGSRSARWLPVFCKETVRILLLLLLLLLPATHPHIHLPEDMLPQHWGD